MSAELPRGVRDCNPGNLRHGQPWDGLAAEQADPSFCTFVSPAYGIRAMCIVLLAYQERHGLKTLRQMISRWAPAGDNNSPLVYAQTVAKFMRVGRDDVLNLRDAAVLSKMVAGIIRVEDADYTYDPAVVAHGLVLAYQADNLPDVISPAPNPRHDTMTTAVAPAMESPSAQLVTAAELNAMEVADPAQLASVGIEEKTVTEPDSTDAGTEASQEVATQ